ncbi:Wzz/FepE/Etk N-terminal domain-containing protein [Polymorphospora rubra]|uniref:Wzz/FepE/Etk N-terminal domain-containing protein n=1 Tax=Polymorphospora rubra TaxID=338584 RepID=UPI00340DAD12
MDASRPVSPDLSDHLGLLRRQWWVVLALLVTGLAAAGVVTSAQTRVYESSTSVLVQPAGQDTNVVGGRTRGDINLDTEAQLVRSTAVATGAAELLRVDTAADELAHDVSVKVPANTSVLVITFAAGDPEAARAGSHAFAEAYLRNREASARADLDTQIAALNSKIKELDTALVQVNGRLAGLSAGSPQRANLESQRATTQAQLNSMTGKLNELTTATVSAGRIISDARLPARPSRPDTLLNLASGGMLGLLLGLGVAAARERLDRRVRAGSDVGRAGVPVLAELGDRTPDVDDLHQPYGPGGHTYYRLRNEVLASLGPDDRIVVVTGASRGSASTLVAANLAAALAHTGTEVVLVGANPTDSIADAAPLARLFGVAPTPGLSEVLAGKVDLDTAAQRAPRNPWLRVLTTGGTATAGGLLRSPYLGEVLDRLSGGTAYVVLEAPSTASSADAQSLASFADAAIIAVELRRTRRPEVSDAARQLHRVGTPLLGAVVMPRLTPHRDGEPGARDGRTAAAAQPAGGPGRADRKSGPAKRPGSPQAGSRANAARGATPSTPDGARVAQLDLTAGTALIRTRTGTGNGTDPAAPDVPTGTADGGHHGSVARTGGAGRDGDGGVDTAVLHRLDRVTLAEMDRSPADGWPTTGDGGRSSARTGGPGGPGR